MSTTATTKRGFDFARGNLFNCDPVTELCLVGGADALGPDESGDLDTSCDDSHALFDPRLKIELEHDFVRNVDAFGIITPVVITRLGDVACVVAGRRRVRAARRVNRERARTGQPLLTVPCVLRRAKDAGLLGAMIAENEAREDDTPLAKLEKLKRLLERGVSEDDAAVTFGVGVATIRGWLAYDDQAVPEVRKLLEGDKITFSAALHIAKLIEPVKQLEALSYMLDRAGVQLESALEEVDSDDKPVNGAKRIGYHNAVNSAKKSRGKSEGELVTGRELKRILDVVREMPHPNASEKTLAWWEGVEDVLVFALGADGEIDERLKKMLADVRADAKAAAKKREAAAKKRAENAAK